MHSISSLLAEAQNYVPEAIELRRRIHRHPEMGNAEERTSALIEEALINMGWEVSRTMGTSVVATLRGQMPGRCVALRADMDALRIQENTGLPFASEAPGIMHACGHDFHCAGLLGAAMLLKDHRDAIKGAVRLLFQPDEEGNGGAQRMMAAGCLEDPHVDAVFGAHVDPDLPAGTIGLKLGKMYAASDTFRVAIRGEGCHGASPEGGIDAIAIGAQVVSALQQIVSRRVAPTDSAVISIGKFHAGTQQNAIADEAILEGIMRTLGSETRARVRQWFRDTVEGICRAMGAEVEIAMRESYPGVVNRDESVALVRDVATDILGANAVRFLDHPTMGTEDFGYYLRDIPGAFFKIGVRNPEIGAVYPIHSPRFIADEAAMPALMAVHAGIALRSLG